MARIREGRAPTYSAAQLGVKTGGEGREASGKLARLLGEVTVASVWYAEAGTVRKREQDGGGSHSESVPASRDLTPVLWVLLRGLRRTQTCQQFGL